MPVYISDWIWCSKKKKRGGCEWASAAVHSPQVNDTPYGLMLSEMAFVGYKDTAWPTSPPIVSMSYQEGVND